MSSVRGQKSVGRILRISGALTAVISLVLGVVVTLTIGRYCGFVGGLGLFALTLTMLAGIIAFVAGLILVKRESTKKNHFEGNQPG